MSVLPQDNLNHKCSCPSPEYDTGKERGGVSGLGVCVASGRPKSESSSRGRGAKDGPVSQLLREEIVGRKVLKEDGEFGDKRARSLMSGKNQKQKKEQTGG